EAVAVRRQALAAGRAPRRCIRAHRLGADVVGDLDGTRPVDPGPAVLRRRALDDQVLVDPGGRRVAVSEGDVDRPVVADDRMRALVLVARGGIRLAAPDRADRGVRAADLDLPRPRRAAVDGLAEADRAVGADAGAG